jgi:hypothetical protein
MMKYSIQKGRPMNFTQGMQWNNELIEFEFATRMAPVGDAEAYGHSLREEEKDDNDNGWGHIDRDLHATMEMKDEGQWLIKICMLPWRQSKGWGWLMKICMPPQKQRVAC